MLTLSDKILLNIASFGMEIPDGGLPKNLLIESREPEPSDPADPDEIPMENPYEPEKEPPGENPENPPEKDPDEDPDEPSVDPTDPDERESPETQKKYCRETA